MIISLFNSSGLGIDGFVINYFFRAIVKLLASKGPEIASVDDVKDEIFDMVKSKTPGGYIICYVIISYNIL